MAKTDWKLTDKVLPDDLNQIGAEINAKETPGGAQDKADQAEQNAKDYTDHQIEDIQFPVTSVNNKTGDAVLTAEDVGLGNVDNLSAADIRSGTTKTNVGLGNVQNYGVATKAQAEAGTANNLYMTPLRTKEAILANNVPTRISNGEFQYFNGTGWERVASKLMTQEYTSPGTYTWRVPEGVYTVELTAVAGGGGGSAGGGNNSSSAHGSAGGVTSFGTLASLTGGAGASSSGGLGGINGIDGVDVLSGANAPLPNGVERGAGGIPYYKSGTGGRGSGHQGPSGGGGGGSAISAGGSGGNANNQKADDGYRGSGGGGGGGNPSTQGYGRGGGGGGGFYKKNIAVVPNTDITITIGVGGVGGGANGGNGGDGYMLIEWWE